MDNETQILSIECLLEAYQSGNTTLNHLRHRGNVALAA